MDQASDGWHVYPAQQIKGTRRWVTLRQGAFEAPTWIPWWMWEIVAEEER
jgi:hypothetical protein